MGLCPEIDATNTNSMVFNFEFLGHRVISFRDGGDDLTTYITQRYCSLQSNGWCRKSSIPLDDQQLFLFSRTMHKKNSDGNCKDRFVLHHSLFIYLWQSRVHGDVFRPPQKGMLLAVLVGNGTQIAIMSLITLRKNGRFDHEQIVKYRYFCFSFRLFWFSLTSKSWRSNDL